MKQLARTPNAEVVTRAITHYTDEVGERLILAAMDCPSMIHIAAQVGVPYRTLRYWLNEGRHGDPRFEYFAAEFDKARGQHEDRYLKQIEDIASQTDNPKTVGAAQRANEFLLKKLFPAQYSDQLFVSTMIERQADGFDLSALPTNVLREFLKTLKVIRASNEGAGEEEVQKLLAKVNLGKTAEQDGDDEADGDPSD
jgi:hypothetical protein